MRKYIARLLTHQAKRYIAKNNFKIVVISGSVGKTSTTQAISKILSVTFSVRATLKNYNSDVGVPCSIFNQELPNQLKNPFAWIWILIKNQIKSFRKPRFSVLVLELGTDVPGEIEQFAWLKPDIAVVTAVADEHMEYFKTLENVAKEELAVASYSEKTIVNKKMVSQDFLQYAQTDELFNYDREDIYHVGLVIADLQVIGEHSVDAVAAGIAVGRMFGMSKEELARGAVTVTSLPGRMSLLKGIKNSVIVDDTYNSSPDAVIAALDYVYSTALKQKIALLGNMNELGETSKRSHEKVGEYCDPKQLDLVVTLGPDANEYIAAAARNRGCLVKTAKTPYEAADIIKDNLKDDAIILCKGSQNKVFAEEAVKLLLDNPEDVNKLVRQSPFWMKIKADCFKVQ